MLGKKKRKKKDERNIAASPCATLFLSNRSVSAPVDIARPVVNSVGFSERWLMVVHCHYLTDSH